MSYNHGKSINNGIAIYFGQFFFIFCNPFSFDPIGRFDCFDAVDGFTGVGRIQSQIITHQHFAFGNFFAFDLNNILIRIDQSIISQSDRWDDYPHVHSELFSENNNPINKITRAAFIYHW
jgi:hypothetical protein